MTTEVWFRNPSLYVRECAELGIENFVWDHGLLIKRRIDLNKFMDLHYGTSPWKALIVSERGVPLISKNSSFKNPEAVFPVWKYGEEVGQLVHLIENPVGLNARICSNSNIPLEFRPRLGQPHRIVVSYLPSIGNNQGKEFMYYLNRLQLDYPECIIHIHGLYSRKMMFGLDFKSVDVDGRTDAAKKKVSLPTGKRVSLDTDDTEEYDHWFNLLGFKRADLNVPRNRCLYNIKSAIWSGKYFKENVKFKNKGFENLDPDDITKRSPNTSKRIFIKNVKPLPDDKFFCTPCSLQNTCKFFRVGAVCSVPDSEPAPLAEFFKTRDATLIMEGMSILLQMEAKRVADARQSEVNNELINPEVTKMLDKIFTHAEKFAKLADPTLRGPSTVNNSQTLVLSGNTPQELASQVMNILVSQGVPLHKITPEMVMSIIESPGGDLKQKAIEASAVLRTSP